MTRLYWYLRGYVQFVFTGGFAEDFINALGELGITLPGLQRQGSDLRGVCSVGTYMQLHKAARQAGGRVRITARRGLPFFLRRLRGRWGLPIGAVAFALVLCVLSGFIWDVQVVGNNRVGTGTLETYLAQNGVAVGKPWQGAARSRLNYRLLRDFPDLAWAHINKVGANARLEVAERVDTPKTKSDKEQSQWGAARRELRCTVNRLQALHLHGVGAYGRDRIRGHLHRYIGVDDGGARQLLRRAGAKPANRSRSGMKTGGKTCRFGRYFSFLEICQITQRILASAPPL